jgi:hypothetical protein
MNLFYEKVKELLHINVKGGDGSVEEFSISILGIYLLR